MSYPTDYVRDFRVHTSRTARMERLYMAGESATLAVMALGLTGEAGEVADEVKKILAHDKPIDRAKIANECGDVLFYIDRVLAHFGLDLADAMDANVRKLNERYPDGFDAAAKKHGFTAQEGA